jgi:hypothetical protein
VSWIKQAARLRASTATRGRFGLSFRIIAERLANMVIPEEQRLRQALREARDAVPMAEAAVKAAKAKHTRVEETAGDLSLALVAVKRAEREAQEAETAWALAGSVGEPDAEPFERLRALRLAAARLRAQAELAGAAEEELGAAEADAQAAIKEWADAGSRGDPPADRLERLRRARLNNVRHRLSSKANQAAEEELKQAERSLADAKRHYVATARALLEAHARPQIESILREAQEHRARYLAMQALATEEQRERARALAFEVDPDAMARTYQTPQQTFPREHTAARDARDNPTVGPERQERIDRLIQDPEAMI